MFASAALPRWASAAGARDPRLVVDHPARRARRPLRRRPARRSRLRRSASRAGADARRPARGAAARRLLRPQPGDEELRPALRREAGARRPRRGDQLSRALAFRRAGRAGERHAGAGPHRERLAQPRRRRCCPRPNARRRARPSGYTPPLVLRGAAPVLGWAPADLPPPDDDLVARLAKLYDHRDPELARALSAGLEAERMANADGKARVEAGRRRDASRCAKPRPARRG